MINKMSSRHNSSSSLHSVFRRFLMEMFANEELRSKACEDRYAEKLASALVKIVKNFLKVKEATLVAQQNKKLEMLQRKLAEYEREEEETMEIINRLTAHLDELSIHRTFQKLESVLT